MNNLHNAFNVAENQLGLTKLLDPEGLSANRMHYIHPYYVICCVISLCRCGRRTSWWKIHHYLCRHLLSLLFQDESYCCWGKENWKGEYRILLFFYPCNFIYLSLMKKNRCPLRVLQPDYYFTEELCTKNNGICILFAFSMHILLSPFAQQCCFACWMQ